MPLLQVVPDAQPPQEQFGSFVHTEVGNLQQTLLPVQDPVTPEDVPPPSRHSMLLTQEFEQTVEGAVHFPPLITFP